MDYKNPTLTGELKAFQPKNHPVILASASPRRHQLLSSLGLAFKVLTSGADEICSGDPTSVAVENSWLKATAVARENPDHLVIGSDTVVAYRGQIYGKPRDLDDAIRMLTELNGSRHTVISGVAVVGIHADIEFAFADTTQVMMKTIHHDELSEYVHLTKPLDKAGAYAIQEFGDRIIQSIDGSFNNVMGFPTELFLQKWNHYIVPSECPNWIS